MPRFHNGGGVRVNEQRAREHAPGIQWHLAAGGGVDAGPAAELALGRDGGGGRHQGAPRAYDANVDARAAGGCFVLLPTRDGSHGLDLSMTSHLYLLEKIWTRRSRRRSPRACRLGATGSATSSSTKGTVEEMPLDTTHSSTARRRRRRQRLPRSPPGRGAGVERRRARRRRRGRRRDRAARRRAHETLHANELAPCRSERRDTIEARPRREGRRRTATCRWASRRPRAGRRGAAARAAEMSSRVRRRRAGCGALAQARHPVAREDGDRRDRGATPRRAASVRSRSSRPPSTAPPRRRRRRVGDAQRGVAAAPTAAATTRRCSRSSARCASCASSASVKK